MSINSHCHSERSDESRKHPDGYIIVCGEIQKIKLSDEELAESEKYEDMESYLSTLENNMNLI